MRQKTARGFTLIELLIVVIIIAILAAIAIPQFSNTTGDAQEAALDANLNTVRSAIELYRVQHGSTLPSKSTSKNGTGCTGTSGSGDANSALAFTEQLTMYSNSIGQTCSLASPGFIYGPYMRAIPNETISNPNVNTVAIVTAADAVAPASATPGWRFNNATGVFQVNSNTKGRRDIAYSAY